ncbi:PspC domain-containing protein [Streptococcus timonensis]|jgi:conserved domain protein|uniref:PspC domain-containing protein n=1 Tax=Streptococcus timonensis TaxID=1852387 RepID=UPI0039C0EE8B
MEKRLVRNVQDKKIGGVCAGLADYFDIDPTLVRALWILFTLLGGSGVLAYVILYFLLPEAGTEA